VTSAAALGLPVGVRAPEFDLPGVNGGRRSLAALRISGQPILLLFVEDPSSACSPLLAEVAHLQAEPCCELTIVVIGPGSTLQSERLAEHGVRNVLIDEAATVSLAFGCQQTPSGVFIGVDGRIAHTAVHGAEAVRRLLHEACALVDDAGDLAEVMIGRAALSSPPSTLLWLDGSTSLDAEAEEAAVVRRFRLARARPPGQDDDR
jgi:peroxiredoxin